MNAGKAEQPRLICYAHIKKNDNYCLPKKTSILKKQDRGVDEGKLGNAQQKDP